MFQVPGRRAASLRIGRYTNFLDTTAGTYQGDGADGNIGGAERQYSGCERTVCKRNIAGVKEDNYSNR